MKKVTIAEANCKVCGSYKEALVRFRGFELEEDGINFIWVKCENGSYPKEYNKTETYLFGEYKKGEIQWRWTR